MAADQSRIEGALGDVESTGHRRGGNPILDIQARQRPVPKWPYLAREIRRARHWHLRIGILGHQELDRNVIVDDPAVGAPRHKSESLCLTDLKQPLNVRPGFQPGLEE